MFYGYETATVPAATTEYAGVDTPRAMYDKMLSVWCASSCAPRLRPDWSEQNPTLGQCSITSFLVQDIFGGKVYGVPLAGGGVHCYNDVNGCVFDLTSEQFGDEKLCYENNPEQFREDHFADPDKYARYLLIRDRLKAVCEKAE